MKRIFKVILGSLLVLGAFALLAFYISTHNIAVLEPKGLIGIRERDLIMTSSLLMLIVVIPVFILMWVFAWKYREENGAKHAPEWEHNYIAEYCWWGVPLVIIMILAVITWKSSHELNPFKPIVTDKKPMNIQVIALQWKWLFLYPEWGIATVNEVHFPEQTPLQFEITADAPMNSFWIPQLGGQIYAMPAMRTKLHLIANEVGTFKGTSANFSGSGFAGMTFTAYSHSEEDFDKWVQSARTSSVPLGWKEYSHLVEPTEYHPVETYLLTDKDLFNQVIMKYMMP